VAYYRRIIDAALMAAGAPSGLVGLVTGYGDAGHALVTGGVDQVSPHEKCLVRGVQGEVRGGRGW
jgi:hypothetical protein